jgi:hypothetical protein
MTDVKHADDISSSNSHNEKTQHLEHGPDIIHAAIPNTISGIDPVSELVFTKQDEAKVFRKLDYRLLPLVFVLYSFSVLDRSNLGNARLAGLEDDIDLGGWRYNWLGTIFYIAYICSQWLQMGWKVFPPHIYCSVAVVFWGFVATIQATVTSWGGLMTCRFFLGVAEAMYGMLQYCYRLGLDRIC